MSDTEAPKVKRSSRDPEVLRARMEAWLARRLPPGADPRVPEVTNPSTNGMSSETLLFDARWTEGGATREGRFVARVEPDPSDVPVFRQYDLELQFRLMQLVREHTTVPVPNARWLELDEGELGARFFVMDRVEGRVPPDVMPYNMESWLLDATDAEREQLEDATIDVLARLHAMDVSKVDVSFLELDVPGDTPLRRHGRDWRDYYDWTRGERRHPTIDRAFAWLEEHWPEDEGDTVVNWGDSRIGNILYDGFTPNAVLDWEMGGVGPRELDVSWMIFLHAFFEHLAHRAGLPGMPDFLRRDRVAAKYEAKSGKPVRNLEFYEMYAALRHAIIMARIFARQVHFGEAEWGDDVDQPILHRELIDRMLDGSYWS